MSREHLFEAGTSVYADDAKASTFGVVDNELAGETKFAIEVGTRPTQSTFISQFEIDHSRLPLDTSFQCFLISIKLPDTVDSPVGYLSTRKQVARLPSRAAIYFADLCPSVDSDLSLDVRNSKIITTRCDEISRTESRCNPAVRKAWKSGEKDFPMPGRVIGKRWITAGNGGSTWSVKSFFRH